MLLHRRFWAVFLGDGEPTVWVGFFPLSILLRMYIRTYLTKYYTYENDRPAFSFTF